MKFSKMLTSLLVMCLLCSMCVSVFAAVVSTDGSTGSVPVTLTTEVPTFSVTVPTALPITVKADGTHVYATNVEIVNNSKGMVHVVDMDIEGANSWVTVDYDSADMASEPVDSQVVALNVNGDKTTGENTNTFTASNYNIMSGVDGDSNTVDITYDAKLPTQTGEIDGDAIANVIFTLTWYK